MFRRPIRSNGDGTFAVELDDSIRDLLVSIIGQLRELVTTDSPVLARLFPPPYGDDEERNAGYAALAGPELIDSRLASLAVVEDTARATTLTEDEITSWMRSINDVRLVLGTILEVTEDGVRSDPTEDTAATWAAYEMLGWVLDLIVEAMDDGTTSSFGGPSGD